LARNFVRHDDEATIAWQHAWHLLDATEARGAHTLEFKRLQAAEPDVLIVLD
jgi:hypothetical protein